jgi:hypothetical protein
MTTGIRSTRQQLAERLSEVFNLILRGGEIADIIKLAAEKQWNVSRRQLVKYQSHALKKMVRIADRNKDKNFSRHILSRRMLFLQAVDDGDLRTALSIADSEAKLLDIVPATKASFTGKIDASISDQGDELSPDDRRAILEQGLRALDRASHSPATNGHAKNGSSLG